jgi:hypothetical protein
VVKSDETRVNLIRVKTMMYVHVLLVVQQYLRFADMLQFVSN